jgi:hypothetical protein
MDSLLRSSRLSAALLALNLGEDFQTRAAATMTTHMTKGSG